MAIVPPYIRPNATRADTLKATTAVRNHPLITVNTPEMRYTALSRPQALSASDEPIATINVTYVVDNGSLSEVPSEISKAETVSITDALIRSNAASLFSPSDTGSKRLSIKLVTCFGVILWINLFIPITLRTIEREALVELNRS